MDYAALRTLIETHPSYPTPTDQELADWCNDDTAVAITKTHLPNAEIQDIALSETADWNAMTEPQRATFGQIIAIRDSVPVENGTPTREALEDILGTATKVALGAALPGTISRAEDANVGGAPKAGDIEFARTF